MVLGNVCGLTATGVRSVNAGDGVTVAANSFAVFLGANTLSANAGAGATVDNSSYVTLQGNRIGATVDGSAGRANGVGVRLNNAANVLVGGTDANQPNTIAYNSRQGILVLGATSLNNRLLGNGIHGNGAQRIDLNGDGPDANDAFDAAAGANGTQNFPVVAIASRTSASQVHVEGLLNSKANANYRVELFAFSSAAPATMAFIGFRDVTTDALGTASFTADLANTGGDRLLATATGTGASADGTSEFSAVLAF